jgi:flavin reductase (DIM6/NTAB) family NADH-FMN oxidoreductase RutF
MAEVSKDAFKKVMGSLAAGVTVVTTVDAAGNKWGLTATAFTSVSLDPPLCLVCVDKRAGSLAALTASRKFAVNILDASQESLSNHFASRADDKFADVSHRSGEETGCPILDGALASMECEVVDIYAGGDHDIFVGKLVSAHARDTGGALVHWRGKYGDVSPRG